MPLLELAVGLIKNAITGTTAESGVTLRGESLHKITQFHAENAAIWRSQSLARRTGIDADADGNSPVQGTRSDQFTYLSDEAKASV